MSGFKKSDFKKSMSRNKGAPAPWCVLPWSHVSVKENGGYRLCCHSEASSGRGILKDSKGRALHVSSASWKDVLNSPLMKSVRKKMLSGRWPKECQRCQREHESGIMSRNMYERRYLADLVEAERYPHYEKAKALTRGDGSVSLEDFPVSYPDIRFGNLCNLKCVMCSPISSSKWYDDFHGVWGYSHFFYGDTKVILIPDKSRGKNSGGERAGSGNPPRMKLKEDIYSWQNDANFWSEMERRMGSFRHIYIAGGEPLLIKSHYDFLKKCVQKGLAPKLNIQYNTNLTVIPEAALDLWRQFRQVLIGVSLDGIAGLNDFIRFPSKWSRIERNLEKLAAAEGSFDIHITISVSSLNIWRLPDFIEYIMRKNYKRVGPWGRQSVISPHPVHRPHYLNVNILEDKFKKEIKERFELSKKRFLATDWEAECGKSRGAAGWGEKTRQACQILDSYAEYMNKIAYSEADLIKWRSNFIHFMDRLDELRKTSWPKAVPELYQQTLAWRDLPKGLY